MAVAANDIWAAGSARVAGSLMDFDAVLRHWDGTRWSDWSSRIEPDGSLLEEQLLDVAAQSPDEVWMPAVNVDLWNSELNPPTGSELLLQTSSGWQETPLAPRELLDALAADGEAGMWAVGSVYFGSSPDGAPTRTLVKRYAC
jgi:hypothetical protein